MQQDISTIDRTANVTRRDAIFGIAAGLGLRWLPATGESAEKKQDVQKRSLIIIWLAGGPSQLETWDPHPGTSIGGPTQSIGTAIRGVRIAADFPLLADQFHHFSVIRSLISREGDHERATYFLKTGYRPDPTLTHPSLGAIAAHEVPSPGLEIPSHVSLGSNRWPARGGYLGDRYDAFKIAKPGEKIRNLTPRVNPLRQDRRLRNLELITRNFREYRSRPVDQTRHSETVQEALRMMNSNQLRAFELDPEPIGLRNRYGDSTLGRGCLVARRLIEQGVRAVEVTQSGFDTHADNFSQHASLAEDLDSALSSLVVDLHERGLLQQTSILCIGEFGRTPQVNRLEGRDHWPHGFSCLLAGGGLRSGLVLGETDPEGRKQKPSDPIPVADLYATLLSSLEIDPDREIMTPIGRPMSFAGGTPIARLLE